MHRDVSVLEHLPVCLVFPRACFTISLAAAPLDRVIVKSPAEEETPLSFRKFVIDELATRATISTAPDNQAIRECPQAWISSLTTHQNRGDASNLG